MHWFLDQPKKPKIGISLSGGGMRGVAHIAVLRALEEYGLKPDVISGTSAGAIVGAFYAAGKSTDELAELVKNETFFSRSSIRFSTQGIFNPLFLRNIFKKYFSEDDFRIMKMPLYVAASELTQGKIEYFSEGALFDALMASASVPFIFPPVILDGKFYVDGGVLNNLPIEPIRGQCDILIGSHVNSMKPESISDLSTTKELDRIFHLAISNSVYTKEQNCNIFLNPPEMLKYSLLRKESLDVMLEEVYNYTCQQLEAHQFKKIAR